MPLELKDIPFIQFQRFLVEKDYSVVGGEENGDRLYYAYLDSIMNLKMSNILYLEAEMERLRLKIEVTQSIVDVLSQLYDKRFADLLREWYPNYSLAIDTISQDLTSIIAECRLDVDEYERYKREINALTPQDDDDNNPQKQYQYYADLTNEIGKMPNVGYIPDDINTQRWCSLCKQLFALYDKKKLENG